jgi:hypothetical protein
MTKDEALKLALEALERIRRQLKSWDEGDKAITVIKQALAAPVQEPVAWYEWTGAIKPTQSLGSDRPLVFGDNTRTRERPERMT